MNVLKAAMETHTIIIRNKEAFPIDGPLSYSHLDDMFHRMCSADMSSDKQNRWLGWMQCAVVATGIASLEDMKQINKANADDPPVV